MRKPSTDDDNTPRDLDELMQRLHRRLRHVDRRAIHCESRRCRRARRCVDVAMSCAVDHPAPPITAKEHAEMLAQLQQAIRAQLASWS